MLFFVGAATASAYRADDLSNPVPHHDQLVLGKRKTESVFRSSPFAHAGGRNRLIRHWRRGRYRCQQNTARLEMESISFDPRFRPVLQE
jgi:hypothetical protein